jgi:hypothetical protein
MANAMTPVRKALLRQQHALAVLADTLVAHGAASYDPFGQYDVPSRTAMLSLDPKTAADWAIVLVHAIFRKRTLPGAVTTATKGVGNAARALRHALERREQEAGRSLGTDQAA